MMNVYFSIIILLMRPSPKSTINSRVKNITILLIMTNPQISAQLISNLGDNKVAHSSGTL